MAAGVDSPPPEGWDLKAAGPARARAPAAGAGALGGERARRAEARRLRRGLARAARPHRPPVLAFERWLARGKLGEGTDTGDPLFPGGGGAERGALARDLERAGAPAKAAEAAAAELARLSGRSAAAVRAAVAEGAAAEGGVQAEEAQVCVRRGKGFLDYSFGEGGKNFLRVNAAHHAKLATLFRRFGPGRAEGEEGAGDKGARERRMRAAIWRLLARYDSLSGPGYQAAVPAAAFRLARRRLGVGIECFASPLNSYFAHFCSAFPDTDTPFGSLGSFFDLELREGSFEANPPFVPEVMDAMVDKMEALLAAAAGPMSFFVVIPAWAETRAFQRLAPPDLVGGGGRGAPLARSAWLREAFVVDRQAHGFCDGGQHQRREQHRPASFDSLVAVLQNGAGAEKWQVGPGGEFRKELGEAFAAAASGPSLEEWEAANASGEKWRRGKKHARESLKGVRVGGGDGEKRPRLTSSGRGGISPPHTGERRGGGEGR